jgi:hypothetical protein
MKNKKTGEFLYTISMETLLAIKMSLTKIKLKKMKCFSNNTIKLKEAEIKDKGITLEMVQETLATRT